MVYNVIPSYIMFILAGCGVARAISSGDMADLARKKEEGYSMKRIISVDLVLMLLMAVVPATSLAAGAVSNGEKKVYHVHTCGGSLHLRNRFSVNVSRVNRAGIDLVGTCIDEVCGLERVSCSGNYHGHQSDDRVSVRQILCI